jgi:hypothetical protein
MTAFFRPIVINVIERKDDHKYVLEKFRQGNKNYIKLDTIITQIKMRRQHTLINNL